MVIKDITHLYDRFSKITNRSSNIVCIGERWNLLEQVGGTPGVGVLDWAVCGKRGSGEWSI